MKKKVYEYLKDYPSGSLLYNTMYGNCTFVGLDDKHNILVRSTNPQKDLKFLSNGNLSIYGENLLFPSYSMRDWDKFAWERGQVLFNDQGEMCIFDTYCNASLDVFEGRYCTDGTISNKYFTKDWQLSKDQCNIEEYMETCSDKTNVYTLNEVEHKLKTFNDGDILTAQVMLSYPEPRTATMTFIYKLNENKDNIYAYASIMNDKLSFNSKRPLCKVCKLVSVDKANKDDVREIDDKLSEVGLMYSRLNKSIKFIFNDGDFVVLKETDSFHKCIAIFKNSDISDTFGDDPAINAYCFVVLDESNTTVIRPNIMYIHTCNRLVRHATNDETEILIEALAKKNKYWDANNKKLIDIPSKSEAINIPIASGTNAIFELDAFDFVLVRNAETELWQINMFGYYDDTENLFACLSGKFKYCIPYNDDTMDLLGTNESLQ